MVSIHNIEHLRKAEQGYQVGLQRRNRKSVFEYVEAAMAQGRWEECRVGITASEKDRPPKTRVQEIAGKEPGVRVFVVHGEEREQYERSMRELSMERTRKALETLRVRVEKGDLKEPEKIGAAASRACSRNHGHRYFKLYFKDGSFSYAEHPVNLEREKAFEGTYIIQT